jgi:hypothetical protein
MMLRAQNAVWRLALMLALGAPAGAAPDAGEPADKPPGPAQDAGKPVVPKPRPKLSPHLTSQISASIPAWKAPPAGQAPPPPPPPPDPDVVQMAPVIVQEKPLPRVGDKEWLTPKARDAALVKEYLAPLDRYFLNRFTLPLFGISKEARARMMYEEDKRLQDLKWINDQIDQGKQLDPQAAKELAKIRNDTFTRSQP